MVSEELTFYEKHLRKITIENTVKVKLHYYYMFFVTGTKNTCDQATNL